MGSEPEPSESSPVRDFLHWLIETSDWDVVEVDTHAYWASDSIVRCPSGTEIIEAYADYVIKHA